MRKSDYILIAALLLLSLIGFGALTLRSNSHNKILIIKQDNAVIKRIALKGIASETKLVLPVKDGSLELHYDRNGAWVVSSPCPDKICLHQGKITKTGETIACVPEQVLLTLETPEREAEHDAILR